MLVLLNISGGGMNPTRSLGSTIFDDTFIDDLGDKTGGTVD
jgi:glycerol uptake facilitator-like aquaporin